MGSFLSRYPLSTSDEAPSLEFSRKMYIGGAQAVYSRSREVEGRSRHNTTDKVLPARNMLALERQKMSTEAILQLLDIITLHSLGILIHKLDACLPAYVVSWHLPILFHMSQGPYGNRCSSSSPPSRSIFLLKRDLLHVRLVRSFRSMFSARPHPPCSSMSSSELDTPVHSRVLSWCTRSTLTMKPSAGDASQL